jgi:hypothetical protein
MHDTGAGALRHATYTRSDRAGRHATDTRSGHGPLRMRTNSTRGRRQRLSVRRLTANTLLGMCRERKDRERRSERKDDFGSAGSIHCWKPLFRHARAVQPRNRHSPLLLTDFVAACLLQIRKIATILRQTAGRRES